MNNPSPLVRLARLVAFVIVPCGALVPARAQTAPAAPANPASASAPAVALDQFVISASRTLQDPRYTASSVSVLPIEDLLAAQTPSLSSALEQQPGVVVLRNGAVGSLNTLFVRGANVYQTLLVVDGVRMNDRTATSQNFLGGADLGGIDRIEVLRGPQSTLYGSSAMGGVILVDTTRGTGAPSGSLAMTAGSFNTLGAAATVKGSEGGLGYSASLSRHETDNDRPKNEFERWSYSARFDYTATPSLMVGATFRGQKSDYHEPGSRLFLSPGSIAFKNSLTTAYAQARAGDSLTSRLTLAAHRRDYVFTSAFGVSPIANQRDILDWQNTWEANKQVQVVAGANYEKSRFTVSGAQTSDRVAAGYLSALVRATDTLALTGSLRHDDIKSAGTATTGRAGFAWRPVNGVKVHATYGTGFSAPGSDDVYGVPAYGQLPSPGLLPEKSRGWDVGVDHDFLGGTITASVTFFKNKFRNLFEYDIVNFTTFEGRIVNRSLAETEGIEVALASRFNAWLKARASYTNLTARNEATGARLIRRPRHSGDAELQAQPNKAWLVGAGVHVVADRIDGATRIEDYTTMRIFTSYAVNRSLLLKLRVENALDESYEEVLGYPALPRGVFGSVEWHF